MIVTPLLFEFYLSSVNDIKDFYSYEQKLFFRINWGEEKTYEKLIRMRLVIRVRVNVGKRTNHLSRRALP